MENLYFVTGNEDKLKEAQSIFPNIQSYPMDLPEIQELDAKKVIEAKLKSAFAVLPTASIIVEDTSLYFNCLKGLPGPFIKWFLQALGHQGLYDLVQHHDNSKAEAKTILGFAQNGTIQGFFEGALQGLIVSPRGNNGFGWDAIFQPDGFTQTFAEMTPAQKDAISMRKIAFEELKRFRNYSGGGERRDNGLPLDSLSQRVNQVKPLFLQGRKITANPTESLRSSHRAETP